MSFTEAEAAYLRSQPLARLATVAADGQPDNAAVGFQLDDDGTIWIGGYDLPGSRKGKNVAAGNDRIALIVDDLASIQPWRPRGVRIYGRAELLRTEGRFGRAGTCACVLRSAGAGASRRAPAAGRGSVRTGPCTNSPAAGRSSRAC